MSVRTTTPSPTSPTLPKTPTFPNPSRQTTECEVTTGEIAARALSHLVGRLVLTAIKMIPAIVLVEMISNVPGAKASGFAAFHLCMAACLAATAGAFAPMCVALCATGVAVTSRR